ncbi:hypothetical protein CAPTEDRAFT_218421 [Capitella teleta]|uniref:Uncharacterized protein n=1 Tax=Capitella teleta TaxID=283909 RepID=R7VJ95_CAPTE|nr:hypothetical protein CAPTEDRAFT_218421 [Capitella teleta]|eukprot:ELU18699.1 hypothetical protein CAPTEDRAFT_218421 [Capitella teleta]
MALTNDKSIEKVLFLETCDILCGSVRDVHQRILNSPLILRLDDKGEACEQKNCRELSGTEKAACMMRFCSPDGQYDQDDDDRSDDFLDLIRCTRNTCQVFHGDLFQLCVRERCLENANELPQLTFHKTSQKRDAPHRQNSARGSFSQSATTDRIVDVDLDCHHHCQALYSPQSSKFGTCVLSQCVHPKPRAATGAVSKRFTNAELDFCATKCGSHVNAIRRACYKGCRDNFRK